MSFAASAPRGRIRIHRPRYGPAGRTRFQEEWEPLDDPEAEDARLHSPRLAEWRYDLAQSIALSACVSAFVTLVLTVRAIGLGPELTETWLTTLKLSLLIGLPVRFLIEPYVARLVGLIVAPRRSE